MTARCNRRHGDRRDALGRRTGDWDTRRPEKCPRYHSVAVLVAVAKQRTLFSLHTWPLGLQLTQSHKDASIIL